MSLIIPKPCKLCGEPISRVNKDVGMKTKSSYARQTYCSSKCSTSARYKKDYEKRESMEKKSKNKKMSFIEMHASAKKSVGYSWLMGGLNS